MELRQMATAFLFQDRKVLMMKKTSSRLYHHEFWSGLGGHIEPSELNDPCKGCLREIHEESGIQENQIHDLKLRYILVRIKEDEIRQQFVYFGRTTCDRLEESDEGKLYWIDQDELLTLHMSAIVKFMLEDYLKEPMRSVITIGTITLDDHQEPVMQWSELRDPMVF